MEDKCCAEFPDRFKYISHQNTQKLNVQKNQIAWWKNYLSFSKHFHIFVRIWNIFKRNWTNKLFPDTRLTTHNHVWNPIFRRAVSMDRETKPSIDMLVLLNTNIFLLYVVLFFILSCEYLHGLYVSFHYR